MEEGSMDHDTELVFERQASSLFAVVYGFMSLTAFGKICES